MRFQELLVLALVPLAFASAIYGTLSGFDRVGFRGTQRHLVYPAGLDQLLWREAGARSRPTRASRVWRFTTSPRRCN